MNNKLLENITGKSALKAEKLEEANQKQEQKSRLKKPLPSVGEYIKKIGIKKKRLTLLKINRIGKAGGVYGWFKCACGREVELLCSNVFKYNFGSCRINGCHAMGSHGHAGRKNTTTEYRIWQNMKTRCYSTKNESYKYYGGRGIRVCDRWFKFENFLNDMGMRPSMNHTMDRINNDGNYEPSNCRWATREQQNRNTRHNRFLELNGEIKIVEDWAKIIGLKPNSLQYRLKNWDLKKALTEPYKRRK